MKTKKAIGSTSLNFIELQTVLTEVEATLYSRPLSFTCTDINDGPTLTPSHFLCGQCLLTLPDIANDSDDSDDSGYIPRASTQIY